MGLPPPCSYRRLSCATCWKIRAGTIAWPPLSAGSLSGASGSAAQLPTGDAGPDRADMASASLLLDEATAAAEAMAHGKARQQTGKCQPVLVALMSIRKLGRRA